MKAKRKSFKVPTRQEHRQGQNERSLLGGQGKMVDEMKDLEYSMVDVMLTILKYSKGRWTSDEVLEFAYLLEGFHEEELDAQSPP
jgi:hypothetical protein